jgi:hypothetical protein
MTTDNLAEHQLQNHFGALIGLPCWQVKQGHGSFITMEFGEPHLKILEPRPNETRFWRKRRRVFVRGEHHLWIEQCEWAITDAACELAHSESDDKTIAEALRKVDGQMLEELEISPSFGKCRLTFEHSLRIRMKRYPADWSPDHPLWHLYTPSSVISFLADGRLQYGPGDELHSPTVECGRIKLSLRATGA